MSLCALGQLHALFLSLNGHHRLFGNDITCPPPLPVHQQFTEMCLLYIAPLIFYFGFVDYGGGMEEVVGVRG